MNESAVSVIHIDAYYNIHNNIIYMSVQIKKLKIQFYIILDINFLPAATRLHDK